VRAELAAGAQLVELPRKACLMVGEKDACPFPEFVTPALWETLTGDEQQGIVRLALCLLHEKSKGASSGYAPSHAFSNLTRSWVCGGGGEAPHSSVTASSQGFASDRSPQLCDEGRLPTAGAPDVVADRRQCAAMRALTRSVRLGRYAPYIQQLPEVFYTLDSFNNKEMKELQYTPRLTEAQNSLTGKRVDALYAKIKSLSPQTLKAVSKEQLQWALQVVQTRVFSGPLDVNLVKRLIPRAAAVGMAAAAFGSASNDQARCGGCAVCVRAALRSAREAAETWRRCISVPPRPGGSP
jgi:hypothetical protein